MTLSPRSCHVFKLGIVCFLFTTASYYLFFQERYDVHDVYQVAVTGRKGAFVQDILENEIDGPFDNSALAALCSTKTWTPGLIFNCEPPQGGVANVRNIFMNCLRYAVEAGATGFIAPEITVRGPMIKEEHVDHTVPFNYFFDQEHFVTSLHTACPQMHIYNHRNDLWDKPSTSTPVHLQRPQLTTHSHPLAESMMLSPSNWTAGFAYHLNASHPTPFSESRPVLVSLHNSLLTWPLSYDPPAFTASFGRVFRFREDVRSIAATVLYAMNKQHQLGFNPEARGIQDGKFYGAHLRTGIDAMKAGWTDYEMQANNYISHAAHNHLPLIYVASDSPFDTLRFSADAGNYSFPMQVVTKTSLLAASGFEKERAELAELTWEQQALVDYEVLLRASKFGGTWESSFAWGLALWRHLAMGSGTWLPSEHEHVLPSGSTHGKARPGSVGSHAGTATRASPITKPTGMAKEAKISGAATVKTEPIRPNVVPEAPAAPVKTEATRPNVVPEAHAAPEKVEATRPNVVPEAHAAPGTVEETRPNVVPEAPAAPEKVEATRPNMVFEAPAAPAKIAPTRPNAVPPTAAANHPSKPNPTRPSRPLASSRPAKSHDWTNRPAKPSEISRRQFHVGAQPFSDAYSIVFSNATADSHPGLVFQLALWP